MLSDSQRIEKIFFWVLLSFLIVGFFALLLPFFSPILVALVLALICAPFYQWLLTTFKGKRYLAAALCMLALTLFLLIPLGAIVSLMTAQLFKVAQTFQWDPQTLRNLIGEGVFTAMLERLQQMFDVEIDLGYWFKEVLHNSAQYLYQFSPKVVTRTVHFFLNGLVTFLITYFFLVDGPKLYHEILDISPLKESHERTLAKEIRTTLRACIYGYILTALVQAILASIGFWIVGMKTALLLGVATFIMCFVPIFGSASVWVPVFIYLLSSAHYGKAAFLFFYGFFVISGIDNVLKPILIQGKTKIHPVLLFLAIFGGLKIWGPIGILAGPTLIAVFLATLRIYRQDFR